FLPLPRELVSQLAPGGRSIVIAQRNPIGVARHFLQQCREARKIHHAGSHKFEVSYICRRTSILSCRPSYGPSRSSGTTFERPTFGRQPPGFWIAGEITEFHVVSSVPEPTLSSLSLLIIAGLLLRSAKFRL